MATYADYDLKKFQKVLAREAKIEPANQAFYDGDHWQAGEGYIGPRPASSGAAGDTVMRNIQRVFTSRNIVREVVGRHVNGVVYRGLNWRVIPKRRLEAGEKPTPQEEAAIKEATDILVAWEALPEMQRLWYDALAALILHQRSVFRMYIPQDALVNGAMPREADPIKAVSYLRLENPSGNSACVYNSRDRFSPLGVISYVPEDETDTFVEATYMDYLTGVTWIRLFKGSDEIGAYPLTIGGYIPMFEMRRRSSFVTPQVRSMQRLANLALTMQAHNIILSGHQERVLLNAQLPGSYKDPDDTGVPVFVPDPLFVGAGTINNFVGVSYTDADGATKFADPSIVFRDPVPVGTFTQTKEAAYMGILEEVHQIHYLTAGDASPSASSRVSSMADHIQDLYDTKVSFDAAVQWALNVALQYVSLMSHTPGHFDLVHVTHDAKVYAGPMTSDMVRAMSEAMERRTISLVTGLAQLGIEDPEDEIRLILAEGPVWDMLGASQGGTNEIGQGKINSNDTRAKGARTARQATGKDVATANM